MCIFVKCLSFIIKWWYMVKNLCVPLCLNKTEIMTNEERFEFIDDFLRRCEDWMHNEDGRDVTISRKYLLELQKQGQKLPIADVGETLDPLCQQIGMNRCDVRINAKYMQRDLTG